MLRFSYCLLMMDGFMMLFVTGTTDGGVGVPSVHGPGVVVCRLFSSQSHAFVSTLLRAW
jgi:hypothetical protein